VSYVLAASPEGSSERCPEGSIKDLFNALYFFMPHLLSAFYRVPRRVSKRSQQALET
jgi:hypothetical protein